MAYDKIITLHGRMDHCIDYVLNEEKTGLAAALAYAENPAKAHQLVTGINCDPDTALSDMRATKRRWDKKGGVLGYHIIHSYAPGEVTPDEAHAAGVEFARRLLGDKYEVVVATHVDRAHLHCHIVFNSVSFVDGKKYRSDFQSYFGDLRGTSNEVSRERGLSVIEPQGHGKHYTEWTAEKQGRKIVMAGVMQDIDAAIGESFTFDSFLAALRRQGYTIKYGSNVKHMAEIIKMLEPEREIATEDGYTGILKPDYTKITVEAAGYKNNSWTVSATRTYPNLSDADASLIPKTITDSGRTLTLANVDWQEAGEFYNAIASYTGTASGRSVTGYTVSVEYSGEVTKTSRDTVIYTAVFSAENASHGETHLDPDPTAIPEGGEPQQTQPPEPAQDSGGGVAGKIVVTALAGIAALAIIGYGGWRGYKFIRDKKRGYV